MTPPAKDLLQGLGDVLRALVARSAPDSRAARHLLHQDVSDTYRHALHDPSTIGVPA